MLRKDKPYAERLRDFHVLLFLSKHLDINDLYMIAKACHDGDDVPEGYRLIIDCLRWLGVRARRGRRFAREVRGRRRHRCCLGGGTRARPSCRGARGNLRWVPRHQSSSFSETRRVD